MTTSNRPVRKRIAADTVTVRGWLDDPTATLTAEWVNPPGQTNACVALVERHGRFWLRGLPLSAGTNEFILKAVDARTNTLVTNLTLVRGALTVTVDPPGGDLWGGPVPVSGTNWSGAVQIGGGGVGVVTVTVYPPGQEPPAPVPPGAPHAEEPPANPENDAAEVANAPEAQWEEPSRLYVERYEAGLTYCEASWAQSVGDLGAGPVVGEGSWSATGTEGFAWQDGVGGWGGWEWAEQFQYPFPPTNFPGWAWGTWTWPATWWPALADAGEEVWEGDWTGGPHTNTLPPPKVLMEQRDTRVRGRWDWNLGQGPNGEPLSGWETWDYRRTALAVVKLFTGSWSVARLKTLWELSGSAAEILDPHAVPPYEWPTPMRTIAPERIILGILGRLREDGRLFASLNKGEDIDITPWVEGGDHLVHSVGGFDRKAHINWSGAGVFTGGVLTNDVTVCWAGQPMNLSLVFEPPLASAQEASNHQWTVEGPPYADIDYTPQHGRTPVLTNLTTPAISYYWARRFKTTVTCEAEAEGEKVEATATFDVRKPTVFWTLTPEDQVRVGGRWTNDTNLWQGYWLTCGLGYTLNDVGMFFSFEIPSVPALRGYTNSSFSLHMVQLLGTCIKENFANPEGTNLARQLVENGVDSLPGKYAYETWEIAPPGQNELAYSRIGATTDTPGDPLLPDRAYLSRQDAYQSYLLFHPDGGKPVPLKVANWNWSGSANRTNGVFVLWGTPTNPQPASGDRCDEPPQWEGRIQDKMATDSPYWQTNSVPFPLE